MYTFLDKRMIKNVICEKPWGGGGVRALKELWEGGQ